MRIQTLVAQAEQEGRRAAIIGEPHHPEVMGVASWCQDPLILSLIHIWWCGSRRFRPMKRSTI